MTSFTARKRSKGECAGRAGGVDRGQARTASKTCRGPVEIEADSTGGNDRIAKRIVSHGCSARIVGVDGD